MMKHNPTMIIGSRDEEPRGKDPRDGVASDEVTAMIAMRRVLRLKESPATQRGPHL